MKISGNTERGCWTWIKAHSAYAGCQTDVAAMAEELLTKMSRIFRGELGGGGALKKTKAIIYILLGMWLSVLLQQLVLLSLRMFR